MDNPNLEWVKCEKCGGQFVKGNGCMIHGPWIGTQYDAKSLGIEEGLKSLAENNKKPFDEVQDQAGSEE